MSVEDAKKLSIGCTGIIISNHGRHLMGQDLHWINYLKLLMGGDKLEIILDGVFIDILILKALF